MSTNQHLQIVLHHVDESMPDADTDILIFDTSSPVGQLGAYMGDDDNGPVWCDAHGQPVTGVTHWSEMPTRQDHVGGILG